MNIVDLFFQQFSLAEDRQIYPIASRSFSRARFSIRDT